MSKFNIHKRFRAGERFLNPGDVVELEGRNLESLVAQRFISPAPDDAAEARVEAPVEPATRIADLTSIRRKPGRPRKSE